MRGVPCKKDSLRQKAVLSLFLPMKLLETNMPFSASVMFTWPWYKEAVDILKTHPEVSVGVHLTLEKFLKKIKSI